MSSGSSVRKIVVVVAFATVIAACGRLVWCEGKAKEPVIRLEMMPTTWDQQERIDAVGTVAGFEDWPRTDVYRVLPRLTKSLLERPEAVTKERMHYGTSSVGRTAWGRVSWGCRRLVRREEPNCPNSVNHTAIHEARHCYQDYLSSVDLGQPDDDPWCPDNDDDQDWLVETVPIDPNHYILDTNSWRDICGGGASYGGDASYQPWWGVKPAIEKDAHKYASTND